MALGINCKTVNCINKACNYVRHSDVLNPKKFGINSIHGINPRITFPATGQSIDLPRFISEEMKVTRKMNQVAVKQIKQPIDRSFLKATAEDFKRLTDTSYEASNLRCVFTNPESGEVFHLLSEGKTKEGLNIIRVLDKDGAYLKTINVKPKKVVILDDYKWTIAAENVGLTGGWTKSMAHGDFVEVMARRNNPFADYEIIPIHDDIKESMSGEKIKQALENLQKRIDSGEQIDFISCSWGRELNRANLLQYAKSKNITLADLKHAPISTDILGLNIDKTLAQFIERNPNIRIIQAAGNGGKEVIASQRIIGNVEGVAALDKTAHYTKYSSGRDSLYTQHMELGEFEYTATPYGYSLTGGTSTEIPFTKNVDTYILTQHGKTPNLFTDSERQHIKELEEKKLQNNELEFFDFLNPKPNWDELGEYLKDLYVSKGRLKETQYRESCYELFSPTKVNWLGQHLKFPFTLDRNGKAMLCINGISKKDNTLCGTSYAAPIRTAKLSLWEMLKSLI